jgi:hypothetical protein
MAFLLPRGVLTDENCGDGVTLDENPSGETREEFPPETFRRQPRNRAFKVLEVTSMLIREDASAKRLHCLVTVLLTLAAQAW